MAELEKKSTKGWVRTALGAVKSAVPVVVKFFPKLALWGSAVYVVVDIILLLVK